jgi:hypothetical protein
MKVIKVLFFLYIHKNYNNKLNLKLIIHQSQLYI